MILLDANVFLRLLTMSSDPDVQRQHVIAEQLFRSIESGNIEAMVSDAVLAEVAFILTGRRHYGIAVTEAAGMLAALLRLRNLQVTDRQTLLRALDLWSERPTLGFVDALTASQARRLNVELATFDHDYDGIDGIRRWAP